MENNNIIKLSEIEKAIQRKIVIIDGVAEWKTEKLNGEIIFNELTESLIKEINDDVIQNLKGEETEEEIAFTLLPYLTNISNDISLTRFITLMESKNKIILMLFEGIMSNINDLFNYADLQKNVDQVVKKLPEIQIETIEDKIIKANKALENEKDTKKKKKYIIELAKLYEKAEKEKKSNG